MNITVENIDNRLISFFRKMTIPMVRFGLFAAFFWFGALKVLGLSPVRDLVRHLFEKTIPFMDFHTFFVLFGLFECLIGVLFLIKGMERIVIPLFFLHMLSTFLPLFLLPKETWSAVLVPTFEGQYIIKNLALIAGVIAMAGSLKPMVSNETI